MALRLAMPLIILAVLVGVGFLVLGNPPEMQRTGPPDGPQTVVETVTVAPRDYRVSVASYGTVQPRTQSRLVAQVGGQIVAIAPGFRPGGFFAEGDTLVTIDPRDYEADVKIAEAALMDALQAEAQESARSEQALTDWRRIGDPNESPSDLVLRKPQLQAAQARVISRRSALAKAQLALERTRVRAPFDGRVLTQLADRGQVVGMGTALAEVYATDYVEIRLPLRNADLPFIELPESGTAQGLPVKLWSELGEANVWEGRIVRTEGAIDETARQLHIVAQVSDPFGAASSHSTGGLGRRDAEVPGGTGEPGGSGTAGPDGGDGARSSGAARPDGMDGARSSDAARSDNMDGPWDSGTRRPLKIGEYVTAEITGRRLAGALVIPVETIYQNSYVYVVEDGELQRRPIEIAWQNGVDALVSAGVAAGDTLVITPLGQVTSGTPVRVANDGARKQRETRAGR